MKNIFLKTSAKFAVCFFLLLGICDSSSCQNRILKVKQLYDSIRSYQIDNPETVLATVIFETGWLECTDCSLNNNNLFGFRLDSGYLEFPNYSECLAYMKRWQTAFYIPWRAKHPDLNYYDFLLYVNYAQNMPNYIKNVKELEHWVTQNIGSDYNEHMKLQLCCIPGVNF